jgi:glycerol-3-phosphate O-acyltransferase
VFYEHLRKLMQRGHSIEFFPEGGRSRSGKLMPPRPGIISMILRSFLGMDEKQVSFVPISINYEKVLEGNSYISEVMGAEKKKENLKDIFSVFRDFRNYLGEAYLQFGEPISLNELLRDYPLNDYSSEKDWLFEVTPVLGKKIMTNINDSTVVTSTALFSLAILNSDGFSISKQELVSRVELLKSLLAEDKYSAKTLLCEKTGEEIIDQMRKLGFLSKEGINDRISLTNIEAAKLSFYRNNISHLLIFESLICGFFQYQKEIVKEDLLQSIKMIYPFLKEEFFLKWGEADLDQLINLKLNKLINKKLILEESNVFKRPDFNSKEFYETQSLGKLVQPSIDRFYVLISQLWKNSEEHISKNELERNSLEILKNLEKTQARLTPEFSEKWMFDVFLSRLIESKYVREDNNGMLYPTRITQRLEKDAVKFLEPNWLKELSKSTT